MNWEIVTWLIIFAVCLIVEIISLGLTTIWACGGALVAMIIAFFGGSLPLQIVGVECTARSKSNYIIPTGYEVVICEISGVNAIVEQADR